MVDIHRAGSYNHEEYHQGVLDIDQKNEKQLVQNVRLLVLKLLQGELRAVVGLDVFSPKQPAKVDHGEQTAE